ncbi:MAG: AAA family ATPase [Bacteroidales bacterium]|nr:AAA family ATPase [Bacteroidales bacterium]
MKILAIRGKNLASLEDAFELDFTSEPLKSAGIFAITGHTGSGKSTILDALCLALFDTTPRTRQADRSVGIPDVGEHTVAPKDCRTILRRGASSGYAEVDFVSLEGNAYRARWSVRRTKDKADGALRETEIKLQNLTLQQEMPGGKKELIQKIAGLTGLTFDQFTRAVLLAQGDFAVFLKAKEPEKAELLEKLTGTDIYSRISKVVYEKSGIAERTFLQVKDRMNAVEILSADQIQALHHEKAGLKENLALQKSAAGEIAACIRWLDDEDKLRKEADKAEQALATIREETAAARLRREQIAQVEQVQEIRETWLELQKSKQQLENRQKEWKAKQIVWEHDSRRLEEAGNAHAVLEEQQAALDAEYARIEPEAKKARALDIRIEEAATVTAAANRDYAAALDAKKRIEKEMDAASKDMNAQQTELQQIDRWLEAHAAFREIIPHIPSLVMKIEEAAEAQKQSIDNRTLSRDNAQNLESAIAELDRLKAEAERLNRLFPAEIAVLRAQLTDGIPCPVCGSLHHPAQSITEQQTLRESELNRAKEQVNHRMAVITEQIERKKAEITRLDLLSERYEQQFRELTDKMGEWLASLPSWKSDFEQGVLQHQLTETASRWQTLQEKRSRAEGHFNTCRALLASSEKNLAASQQHLETQETKRNETKTTLERLQKERAAVLDGKAVDPIAQDFALRKKHLTEKLETSAKNRMEMTGRLEHIKGVITQMSHEIALLEKRHPALQAAIDSWLGCRQHLTAERLAALLSLSDSHINKERQYLNDLKERETIAITTLEERKQRLAQHLLSAAKPAAEENRKSLTEKLAETEADIDAFNKRFAEIDLALAQHDTNEKLLKDIENELEKKEKLSEDWKKLNYLFGSANGSKFKEIAQAYTLDILLTHANQHLRELSGRYLLQRVPNTLALQVTDLDMAGEIRTVHSLSGGESFLISLALSLGLSSLSSRRLKIESLFIDEGFGSLDTETLRTSMDALERLQSCGRKIGVISHVAEMTERIAAQVRVIKTARGKSAVTINL